MASARSIGSATTSGTVQRNWRIVHPRDPYPHTIMLMAAPDTDWTVLRHVLVAAAQANQARVSFVVAALEPPRAPFAWSRFEER